MIDTSGRTVRAGIRGFTAVATASCFAVMPQVTGIAAAHTEGKAARAHDHTTPSRNHDGRDARDHGRGRADVVVDTRGPKGVVVPGRTYEWPFEVTNRGTAPAKDVSLSARPDRHLKVLAAPPKCHWTKAGPLVCDIGLLPQGHSKRGVITATIVPPARPRHTDKHAGHHTGDHTGKSLGRHAGRSLDNPIQVSWRNAPKEARLMAAFPPVDVSPADGAPVDTAPPDAAPGGRRVPYPLTVTEHGPVTAESVVVRSPIGLPAPAGPCAAGVAPGKAAVPAPRSCAAKQDDPRACACSGAHQAPVGLEPDLPAPNRPVTAPCGAAARPVVIPDRPLVPPCAQTGPAAWVDEPAEAPCGVLPARPASSGRALLPPCAHAPVAVDRPATPCHAAADRPVILPAPVGAPAAAPCGAVADRPATVKEKRPAELRPVSTPAANDAAHAPAAAPCGAAATRPGTLPGRPVTVPAVPVSPCAHARSNPCGCVAAPRAPEAPASAPVITPGSAPCAVTDAPVTTGKATPEAPLGSSCGHGVPAAVHEEPAGVPSTVEPMTPQNGPGKAAHDPAGLPHHHGPGGPGRPHRDCVRQGSGFVCPLGSAPGHRPHVMNLHHPHALHCVSGVGAGCHTREARPLAVRPQPVGGNLPTTGSSSALLALSGLGLAGAGMVLYRLSRTRTRREEAA